MNLITALRCEIKHNYRVVGSHLESAKENTSLVPVVFS